MSPISPENTMEIARINQEISTFSNPHINKVPLCFIYRLPVDTLRSIFIEYASDYFLKRGHHFISTAPCWVNVSYVSRHWRDVALNCPTLWTYLFILSPRWTEELLARSKQASLKIYMIADYQTQHLLLRFIEQVRDHVERIEELHIKLSGGDERVLYELSSLSSPALRLQHLEISIGYPSRHPSRLSPQLPFNGHTLFNGHTPVLRKLQLSGYPISWHQYKLCGLAHLSLCNVPSQSQQTIVDFLAVLSDIPNLQHLHLGGALASATGFISSSAFHTIQKVDLLHLSQLFLSAPLSTVIALLSCMSIPLKTALRMELRYTIGESSFFPNHFSLLCDCLTERYCTLQHETQTLPPIRSVIIADTSGMLELGFSTVENDYTSFGPSKSLLRQEWHCVDLLQVSMSRSLWNTPDGPESFITCLFRSLPLSTIRSIHVTNPWSSMDIWMDILEHLPDLRYLKLSHGTMPNLVPILSPMPHNSMGKHDGAVEQGQSQRIVPALEALQLDKIEISASLTKMVISPDETNVQSLLSVLSTRTLPAQGRLRMTRCVHHITKHRTKQVDLKASWGNGYWGLLLYNEDVFHQKY